MMDFNDPIKLEEARKAKQEAAEQEERMGQRVGLDDDAIIEVEFALIGGFVNQSMFLDEVPTLEAHHFGSQITSQVFRIIRDRHKRGLITDASILKHHLKENGYLWDYKMEPETFVDDLSVAGVNSVLQIRSYAELILDHNAKIDLKVALGEAQNSLFNPELSANYIIDNLDGKITSLAPVSSDMVEFMSVDDAMALPPLEWAVSGFLQEVGLSCIYAPSFTGKSYLALDMALSVAQGTDWHGAPTKPMKVAYIAAEGARGMSLRANAWLSKRQAAEHVPFLFYRQPVDFFDVTQLNHFIKMCENTGVRFVVVDTLARCFGGHDENSTQDMSAFIEAVDKIKRAIDGHVMIVHHTGKETDKGARGSTHLRRLLIPKSRLKKTLKPSPLKSSSRNKKTVI